MRSTPLLCLLLIASAYAADLPGIEQMRKDLDGPFKVAGIPAVPGVEDELARQYLELAVREAAAQRKELRAWDRDPRAKLLTRGDHTEHGIRPNTQLMIALAVASRFGPEAQRQPALDDLVATLRFVAPTHSAGPALCSDNKKWQIQWQSALWAFQMGKAAWLVWDKLDDESRWLIANCLASEADRFLKAEPPYQIKNDTKAEENAWNSTVVALAACMFPQHPRAAAWHEAAVRWQLSSFLTKDDLTRDTVIDGKSLKDWKLGANVHPDYTLENHDRVHPSYMGTIGQTVGLHLIYRWGGRKPPEALAYNTRQIYAHLKFFTHPDGRMHFPNGQDWELHRLTCGTHAMSSLHFNDAEAALLERVSLETVRRMQQRSEGGPTLLKQEYFFPSLPGMYASDYASCFLLHATYGSGPAPVAAAEFQRAQASVRYFEHGQFIAQRTPRGWVSFAWGNRVMGQAIPFASDLLGSPYELGYVGSVEIEAPPAAGKAKPEYPKVDKVELDRAADRFAVRLSLSRSNGAIGQNAVFVSLPDGSAVYLERIVARQDLTLARCTTGTIGVLNEPEWVYQSGPRKLAWEQGSAEVDGRKPGQPFAVPGAWVGVDSLWGHVALGDGAAWRYAPNDKVARGRREQLLFLDSPAQKQFKAGEVIAQRGVMTLLGRTADETAALSKAAVLKQDGAKVELRVASVRLTADLSATPPTVEVVPQ